MTNIPEYGKPDKDTPELADRDFALARRRDGTLVNPVEYVRVTLSELETDLAQMSKVKPFSRVLTHLKAAQAEMEEG